MLAVPVVLPCGIKMLAGIPSFLGSKPRFTVTPPAGAAGDSVTVKIAAACDRKILVVLTDIVIVPGGRTVTLEVVSG